MEQSRKNLRDGVKYSETQSFSGAKPSKVLEALESLTSRLECEPVMTFGTTGIEHVKKVAVCVDPGIEIMQSAKDNGFNVLISHHYPTKNSRTFAESSGIYCVVAHLRQDAALGGNIDVFADFFSFDIVEPFTIRYKGMVVERGAVIGEYKSPEKLDSIVQRIEAGLVSNGLNPKLKTFNPANLAAFSRVGVTTGAALKPEFLEQISVGGTRLYVAAEMEQPAVMLAHELGIALIDAGHYESEVPGMRALAEKLDAEFIPNNYCFR